MVGATWVCYVSYVDCGSTFASGSG
jgi:hypothetical protein